MNFAHFFQVTFYTWIIHLGTRMVEIIKPSCSEHRRTEAVLHLKNSLNVTLNLNENSTLSIRIFMKDTLSLGLEII